MKRNSRFVKFALLVGGLIVAAINGKYFGAYNDPPIGSVPLYLLTVVLLGGGLISAFRAWLSDRST